MRLVFSRLLVIAEATSGATHVRVSPGLMIVFGGGSRGIKNGSASDGDPAQDLSRLAARARDR
jgi:hypothetical protein